jgi:hypothetical protein
MAVLLSTGLTSLLLCCDMSLLSVLLSTSRCSGFGPPFQEGRSHVTPVKLLTVKGFRTHFRTGFPDRSSARRPALMAP